MPALALRLPRICIFNPNTSPIVSRVLLDGACDAAAGRAEIHVETAPFGAEALATVADLDRAREVVCAMAECETWADAIIVGAFGDPGLCLLRRRSSRPVFGLGEAGLLAAAQFGRFEILTMGSAMRPDILARAEAAGHSERLIGLAFLDAGIVELAANPELWREAILDRAEQAKARGAACLLLGGAPFSGLGRTFDGVSAVPVIDGTSAAIKLSIAAVLTR